MSVHCSSLSHQQLPVQTFLTAAPSLVKFKRGQSLHISNVVVKTPAYSFNNIPRSSSYFVWSKEGITWSLLSFHLREVTIEHSSLRSSWQPSHNPAGHFDLIAYVHNLSGNTILFELDHNSTAGHNLVSPALRNCLLSYFNFHIKELAAWHWMIIGL